MCTDVSEAAGFLDMSVCNTLDDLFGRSGSLICISQVSGHMTFNSQNGLMDELHLFIIHSVYFYGSFEAFKTLAVEPPSSVLLEAKPVTGHDPEPVPSTRPIMKTCQQLSQYVLAGEVLKPKTRANRFSQRSCDVLCPQEEQSAETKLDLIYTSSNLYKQF